MNEIKRLQSLFEKLYNGDPWIDISILPVLEELDADTASARPVKNCNSIWEIVNHLVSWRKNVVKRLKGEAIRTPSHNYFKKINTPSEKAWRQTLQQLDASQKEWLQLLKKIKVSDFGKQYAGNNMTYYEHIQGILQHDAYHLGQIVLLLKMIRANEKK